MSDSNRIEEHAIIQYINEEKEKLQNEYLWKAVTSSGSILERTRRDNQLIISRTNEDIPDNIDPDNIDPSLIISLNKMTPGKAYLSSALFYSGNNQFINNISPSDVKKILSKLLSLNLIQVVKIEDRTSTLKKIEKLTEINAPEEYSALSDKYKTIIKIYQLIPATKDGVKSFIRHNNDWKDLITPILQKTIDEQEASITQQIINEGWAGAAGRPKKSVDQKGQHCVYCGNKINYGVKGIDRAENKKTYLRDNIVLACPTCNKMKHDLNIITFLNQSKNIAKHLQDNNLNSEDDLKDYIQRKNQELLKLIDERKPTNTSERLATAKILLREAITKKSSRHSRVSYLLKQATALPPEIHYHHPDDPSLVVDTHPEISDLLEERDRIKKLLDLEENPDATPLRPFDKDDEPDPDIPF